MKKLAFLLVVCMALFCFSGIAVAKDTYEFAWSHYTGWEPWELARFKGILDKWATKYGIEIKLSEPMDYIESINLYTSGTYDACVMTNMDMLTIPAVGGIDSTALVIGDFSNGNDGLVAKNAKTVKDLKGRKIHLVMFSVSHYFLARILEKNGMTEKDVELINVSSESELGALFNAGKVDAIVTWNPTLMQTRSVKGARLLADSSQIPGEIIDMLVVRTDTPDSFKKALVGAWYETMDLMSSRSKEGKEAVKYMAKFAGGTEAEFRAQLRTTKMFYKPADAVEFIKGEDMKKTMEYVRTFSFDHGLYGEGAASKDLVGIQFPDGSVMGDTNNVKMRFDTTFTQMAADGQL